jgi:hypothetical protein
MSSARHGFRLPGLENVFLLRWHRGYRRHSGGERITIERREFDYVVSHLRWWGVCANDEPGYWSPEQPLSYHDRYGPALTAARAYGEIYGAGIDDRTPDYLAELAAPEGF